MENKVITLLLGILLALGGWNLSQTFSLSKDMVLVKEKISQIEETLDKKSFPKKKSKKKKKKKKQNNQ
tara:strand:- start:235 stop:438 length:204 start_codon:yes stop_codon:yes gene_type:complete